jgi:hypothetical protein
MSLPGWPPTLATTIAAMAIATSAKMMKQPLRLRTGSGSSDMEGSDESGQSSFPMFR